MVRSLDTALTTALTNATRVPAFKLTIEDHVHHYAQYQAPGAPDAWNDACIANDNSIIRVQVPRGGSGYTSTFQVQRITDPAQASQWTSWVNLPGSSGLMFQDGGCAVATSGGFCAARHTIHAHSVHNIIHMKYIGVNTHIFFSVTTTTQQPQQPRPAASWREAAFNQRSLRMSGK